MERPSSRPAATRLRGRWGTSDCESGQRVAQVAARVSRTRRVIRFTRSHPKPSTFTDTTMLRSFSLARMGVLAAVALAAATAAPAPSDPAPSTTASSAPSAPDRGGPGERGGKHGRLAHLGRRIHGEWVAKRKDGTYVTVVAVRGEVTAVSESSITVKAEDGFTATYSINAETVVRGKGADSAGEVKVGDRAGVIGAKGGDGALTARLVAVRAK